MTSVSTRTRGSRNYQSAAPYCWAASYSQSLVTLLLRERVAADRTYRGEQIDSLRRLLKRFQPGDIVACPPYDGPLGHLRSFFYKFRMLYLILSPVPVSFVR